MMFFLFSHHHLHYKIRNIINPTNKPPKIKYHPINGIASIIRIAPITANTTPTNFFNTRLSFKEPPLYLYTPVKRNIKGVTLLYYVTAI